MIHPVNKAKNQALRKQYYGVLGHEGAVAGRDHYGKPDSQWKGWPKEGPERGGGSKVPAKPKGPTPSMPARAKVH